MEDKKIKLCIFDLAGTLVQDKNYVRKIFIQAFKKYDIVVTAEVVDRWMGFEKKLAIDSERAKKIGHYHSSHFYTYDE